MRNIRLLRLFLQRDFLENLITFVLFSIIITALSNKLPNSLYTAKNRLLKLRSWEKHGKIYQQIFHVRVWKKFLPELSDFVKGVFPKKKLKALSNDYLQQYIFESCKSEITHWCIIFSTLLFYLWCDFNAATSMLFLACVLNLPYIIIQRYNRPRLMEMVQTIESHGRKVLV